MKGAIQWQQAKAEFAEAPTAAASAAAAAGLHGIPAASWAMAAGAYRQSWKSKTSQGSMFAILGLGLMLHYQGTYVCVGTFEARTAYENYHITFKEQSTKGGNWREEGLC